MRRFGNSVLIMMTCAAAGLAHAAPPADVEARMDAQISPAEMEGWLKHMASGPNHVGSAHNKANADWVLERFKAWGWDARIETFSILYPTPVRQSLQLLGDRPFAASLTERAIPGAEGAGDPDVLPSYLAYQGDGDVTAPLVYANYGMPDDYEALKRLGVSVEGKIVIVRYGGGWRGLKPKLAQEHGALGCIIYSDPQQDGYVMGDPYPEGGARPAQGVQRGSVVDMSLYPGDPLTPGIGATDSAARLKREDAASILKIPAVAISYGDAQTFLASLKGGVVPAGWRGGLPITYHVGGTEASTVRLVVKSDWSRKTIHNVVATMKGSEHPDQWVLRGNHRDAWVYGAADPLAGHVAMLAEAQAIGRLAAQGYRPKRTLVYLSWDAEEAGIIGSTEWVEAHASELKAKAVAYVNTDNLERGLLRVEGSHSYERLVNQVANDVTDPDTGVSLAARWRAALRVAGARPGADPGARARSEAAADPVRDLAISPLGSGSDYAGFIGHLGIPSIHLGFDGEGASDGVYHSAYDSFDHFVRFDDPGLAYSGALAKVTGRIVLRLADADLPVQRFQNFATALVTYNGELKVLAKRKRDEQLGQKSLLSADLFRVGDGPDGRRNPPTALAPVPEFNFAPLDRAVAALTHSARTLDAAIEKSGAALSPSARATLFESLRAVDQGLVSQLGLPERPWFRNLIYAPGRFTGYGAKTLPAVREAIEEERWLDAHRYIPLTAAVIDSYAATLDRAAAQAFGK